MNKVTIIGMGLSVRDLTAEHLERIRSADVLVGGRRHLAAFEDLDVPKREITGRISETIAFIRSHMQDHRIVVLASGDPLFFGVGARICRELGTGRTTVMPNISSIAAAFARIQAGWDDARIISLHGRDRMGPLLQALKDPVPVAVLTDDRRTPDWLAARLLEKEIDHVQIAVFEQLGTSAENFGWYSLPQAAQQRFARPNVVILKARGREAQTRNDLYLGMGEEVFAHDGGLITKAEVRAVCLARLRLKPGQTLWDLGAGSGAVSIEASLLLGGGRIVAVEQNEARVRQIRANARRFGVYNLDVVQAELPQGLEGLPAPDRIFIGGGGRHLPRIIAAAAERLPPRGVMVANTVLLGNLQAAMDAMEQRAMTVQVVQVQVSRCKTMPWDRRLVAQNPVWVVVGERKQFSVKRSAIRCPGRPFA
jgi:precorrin-6B C5,15-methyltransferase / cobalt-precorrin-6B C5,C15-methyltransferase